MIEAQNLSLRIGGKDILHPMSFELTPGKRYCIIGPNGAGKSSLFRCLGGSHAAYSGSIFLEKQDLRSLKPQELAKQRAVLSQSLHMSFPFRAEEIILLGRSPHSGGRYSKRDREIAAELLERLHIKHLRLEQYRILSGGEQQRVHLARVLAQLWDSDRGYLFLDEPTSALDLKQIYELFCLLDELKKEKNLCVVMILHDLSLVRRFSDEVLVLSRGNLRGRGVAEDVITPSMLEDIYELEQEAARLLLAA